MIQASSDKNQPFEVRLDDQQGLFMLFVHRDMLGTGKVFTPLWMREFGNEESRR